MRDLPRYPLLILSTDERGSELAAAELWAQGALGVEERDASTLNGPDTGVGLTLVASFENHQDAQAAARLLDSRFGVRLETLEGDSWRDAWKAYFTTSRIGERLVVRPPWQSFEAGADDVVLTLDPGRAFGTGGHESTRLVLSMLDDHLKPGMHVLDVGCGSGILSIACLLLGAARATAIDVDREAAAVTQENAVANAVQERIHVSDAPITDVEGEFELVLANIESRVLTSLASDLSAHLAVGGVLIVSGLLVEEKAQVTHSFGALSHLRTRQLGEWLAMSFEAGS